MLPPSINVPVLISVILTLSVVDVIVAASNDTTVTVLVVFATTSKLDRVIVLLLDIVDVGEIGAPSDDKISVVLLSMMEL